MTQSFKCPSCNAPLEYEGKTMQKCKFCGSTVIVPSGTIENSNSFGGFGQMNFGDLSDLKGKALNIAEIQQLLQSGNKIQAIKLFRETFGVGLREAKDAVEAMERGESVDISGMHLRMAQTQMSAENIAAVKKAGKVVGGSLLGTFLVTAFLIVAAIVVVFYLVSSSINRAIDKTFVTNSNKTANGRQSTEKTKLAEELLKFGGKGNGAGKFDDNRHVAVDGSGHIYSGDYQGGKIQVFDAQGKYLTQWTADAKMNLYELCADRKGNVYVLQNRGIFVYKGETGELVDKLENYDFNSMALRLDGKIVVTKDKEIWILDSGLKTIQQFKDAGERADTIFGFESVAVDGNNQIYALDRQKGDICKFSADGKFLNRFNAKASIAPMSLAVDNKGRIYASDVSEINVFDENGQFINSFPETQAFGMVFNDADELFVASRPFVVKYKINF